MKEGDRNTKFFHARAIWRARKNRIKKSEDVQGTVHTEAKEMWAAASTYFENIFKADPSLDPSPITNLFSSVVTDEMNNGLCAGIMPLHINDTIIVMILKVGNPVKITDSVPLAYVTSFTKWCQSAW